MEILIDTREQAPYDLVGAKKATLHTGDYTVAGYKDDIAVERKSYSDLYHCLTTAKKRFEDQLKRLGEMDYAYLLIDTTASAVLMGHPQCKLPGEVALSKLVKLTTRYDVPFCFADNRGGLITRNLLLEMKKKCDKEGETYDGYVRIADLEAISGIGPKLLEKIKQET